MMSLLICIANRITVIIATSLCLLMTVACRGPSQTLAMPQITATKPDTQIESTLQDDTLVLTIHSASGIGSAEVNLPAPRPKRVVIRLYVQGLEDLQFEYADATIQASISSGPGHVIGQRVRLTADSSSEGKTSVVGSPYWMPIRLVPEGGVSASIPLQQGYIEVTAPPGFSTGNFDRFSLRWIDFYR